MYILPKGNYYTVIKVAKSQLKLQLIQDNKTLLEIPLSPQDWSKEDLENEFNEVEDYFERFSKFYDALSHETRLRMMKRLIEEENHTMRFADFMRELDLNPKTVWENSRKLEEGGLLEKKGRGKYSCSNFGQTAFIMINFALRRLVEFLEGIEDY